MVFEALSQNKKEDYLDLRPHLQQLTTNIFLFHGLQDDVIPSTEMNRLKSAIPNQVRVHTFLTGLYGHTKAQDRTNLLHNGRMLLREFATLVGMLKAMVQAPGASFPH